MLSGNRKMFRVLVMLVVLAFLVMSSSVFALEMKPLKKDKISPKYQSIIFGRLRLLSAVPKFNPLGNEFIISLFDLNENKPIKDFRIVLKSKYRIKTDEVKGYDTPFYGEGMDGEYMFGKYRYLFSNVNVGDLSVNGGPGGYLYGISGRLSTGCSIPPGSLVYMGVIEIKYNEVIVTEDNNLRVDTDFDISFDDFEKDLNDFKAKHPKLYEQFKDNIVNVQWEI